MKTSSNQKRSRKTEDTLKRRLQRVVGPQIAGVVRLRRLNLDKALRLRNAGDIERAKVWERGADSYANEVCELLEALRPNDQAHRSAPTADVERKETNE